AGGEARAGQLLEPVHHHVHRDEGDRDHALTYVHAAADRGTRLPGGLRLAAHALRALVADRRADHAVGADRAFAAVAAQVGLAVRVPVTRGHSRGPLIPDRVTHRRGSVR